MLDSVPAPKLGYVVTGLQSEAGYSGSYGYAYGYGESGHVRNEDAHTGRPETLSGNGRVESAREEETV